MLQNLMKILNLNLRIIEASVAGPKRPQDKILLKDIPQSFKTLDTKPIIDNKPF